MKAITDFCAKHKGMLFALIFILGIGMILKAYTWDSYFWGFGEPDSMLLAGSIISVLGGAGFLLAMYKK